MLCSILEFMIGRLVNNILIIFFLEPRRQKNKNISRFKLLSNTYLLMEDSNLESTLN